MSNQYELFCVFPGTFAEEDMVAHVADVKAAIEEQGIENVTTEDMGKARLAYPMKHIRYGYFIQFIFEATGEQAQSLQKKLKLLTTLLRAMLQRYDMKASAAYKAKIAEMKAKSGEPTKTVVSEEPKKEVAEKKTPPKKEKVESKKVTEEKTEKPSMTDIDKKLDEILEKPIQE